MDTHLAEDEDLQKLKEWWKKNGMSIMVGIGLGITAIVGYNGWNLYSTGRAETASLIYTQLRASADQQNAESVGQLARELRGDFASTPYAADGAMIAARVFYDAGNSEAAREMLGWVIDNAGDPSNLHLARVRLAYLEVGEGNPERALELLQVDDENGFTSHYAEIRGDAQVSLGDPAAARQSYEQALAALPATSTYESVLRAKRNSVAGAN